MTLWLLFLAIAGTLACFSVRSDAFIWMTLAMYAAFLVSLSWKVMAWLIARRRNG